MVFYNFKKKLEEENPEYKKIMIEKLNNLNKLINSELANKILNSSLENNELMIEINDHDLIEVIQFLKSNEKQNLDN